MRRRIGLAHIAAGLADHHAQFALVHHIAVVGCRHANRRAVRVKVAVGLEEIQRFRRNGLIELRRQRAEVVPERHHLVGHAGGEERDVLQRDAFAGGLGVGEEVAGVDGDGVAFESAEGGGGMGEVRETEPSCHIRKHTHFPQRRLNPLCFFTMLTSA